MAAICMSIASYVGLGSGSVKGEEAVTARKGVLAMADHCCRPSSSLAPASSVSRSRSISFSSSPTPKGCSCKGCSEMFGLGVLGVGEEEREIGIGMVGRKGGVRRNDGGLSLAGRRCLARSAADAAADAAAATDGTIASAAVKERKAPSDPLGDLTVVMTFGGASVATSQRVKEVANMITSLKEERPVLIMSGMGKTTDNLLKAGARALECGTGSVDNIEEVKLVSDLFFRMADELGVDRSLVTGVLEEISQLLMGITLVKELSPYAKNRLISLGECMSAGLFAAYLEKLGVKTSQVDISSLVTNDVLELDQTFADVRDRLRWSWETNQAMPIVTGSLDKEDHDGEVTARVVGGALGLKEIQVCEVVDGAMKSAPQLVGLKAALQSQRVLQFEKYHGLGNDFLLVDNTDQPEPKVSPEEAQRLCDRKFGVGGDGVIFALPGPAGSDFAMRIYNSDGSEPEMCGNGIRCMAKFIHGLKNTKKAHRYVIDTLAGPIIPVLQEDGQVMVDMGPPTLNGPDVPTLLEPTADGGLVLAAPLEVAGKTWSVTCVSMGNPHCITFGLVGAEEEGLDVASLNLEEIGPQFEKHPAFPARTNTEFVQVLSRTHLRMRVWERGAGATLACGTGACALVVAAVLEGRTDRKCRVELPGGPLDIEWREEDNHVYMTGPAVKVFEGKAYL